MLDRFATKLALFFCIFVLSSVASKCPESRKPHVTSCTIFYNCINLPDGGYVWAPSKCPDGLVFQPFLRICVLPGDTWTCEDQSIDKPWKIDRYDNSELIDPSKTSYLGFKDDSSSSQDRPTIDSSYKINDSSELGNLRPFVTPYPLIEISKRRDENVKVDDPKEITILENRIEDYLYRLFARRLQMKLTSASINKEEDNWLRRIVDKMMLYENFDETRTTCETSFESNFQENHKIGEANKDMLNFLVQRWFLGRRRSTILKSSKRKKNNNGKSMTTVKNNLMEDHVVTIATNIVDYPSNPLIDEKEFENRVIAIEGNLGGKEYVSISKYKSLSVDRKIEILEILPCARGIRLPNRTDCTRYYTCDPETAVVIQFSCSSRTAFNDYNRVCEIQRFKNCARQTDEKTESTTNFVTTETTLFPDQTDISEGHEPCRNTGKYVDSISEKHYYVCYSSQSNPSIIESLRMVCPNDLIFCQDRRVCSTRKRCYDN